MKAVLKAFLLLLLLTISPIQSTPVYAADIRSDETVIVAPTERNLSNLYLFGEKIQVDAPVGDDLVMAGGNLTLNEDVARSVFAAGGNIDINGNIGGSLRIAGGNITIDGEIENDLVVTGGSVTVTENASIDGDVLFAGGELRLEGPVRGKVLLGGGDVQINNSIGGSVQGDIEKLTLGENAVINGNLSYTSPERATIDEQSIIRGKTDFKQNEETEENFAGFFAAASVYMLIADIIISIILIFFFKRGINIVLQRMKDSSLKSGVYGFAYLILVPIASLMLLVLMWLGIASFLIYTFSIFISLYLVKIFAGWLALRWYEKRGKRVYDLDWKAGIAGPILVYVLSLIPILGWLTAAILFFIAVGAFINEIVLLISGQKTIAKPMTKSSKKK